jgi:hypothetical protein
MRIRIRPGGRKISDTTVYTTGVLASLAATVITLAVTWAEGFTSFQILVVTALIFIAGSLVVLMIETRRRADRTGTLIEMMDSLARTTGAYVLFKEVGESLAVLLDRYPHQAELDIAWQTAMKECHKLIEQLGQGYLEIPSGDVTYLRAFLEQGLQLRTTSPLKFDLDWWPGPEGQAYWSEQLIALKTRGQKIERIFIYDDRDNEIGEKASGIIKQHAAAGVETYVISESRLPQDDIVDITLWGGKVLFHHKYLRKQNPDKWYDRISVHPEDIEQAERQYSRIRALARRVDENWDAGEMA